MLTALLLPHEYLLPLEYRIQSKKFKNNNPNNVTEKGKIKKKINQKSNQFNKMNYNTYGSV
jgi:hypothetical protein